MDQETAWRLFTKELTTERAVQSVRREGDPALADAVLEMVSIIA